MAHAPSRKPSSSLIFLVLCAIGVGVGLLGLNYWHTNKCTGGQSTEEIDNYIEALNKRLLQAEAKSQRSSQMMEKLITLLQTRIIKLDKAEYNDVAKYSNSEAIRVALILAQQPPPAMPEFEETETSYKESSEKEFGDDLYGKDGEYQDNYNDLEGGEYNDKTDKKDIPHLTDAETVKLCTGWRDSYSVLIGVSWGNLPYDLQQKWVEHSCDYHMADASSAK